MKRIERGLLAVVLLALAALFTGGAVQADDYFVITPPYGGQGYLGWGDYTIEDGSYVDIYEFYVNDTSDVRIDLSSYDFDAVVFLINLDTGEYWVDNDSGPDSDARIQTTVEYGTYWVVVNTTYRWASGAYRLDVDVDPLYWSTYPVITGAGTWQGSVGYGDTPLGDGSYLDIFEMRVTGDPGLRFEVQSYDFEPWLIIINIDTGEYWLDTASNLRDGYEFIDPRLTYGNYWVVVNNYDGYTGSYTLRVY